MMRKVNKVGKNTLTISLPNNWVKQYGIKKGDELSVYTKGIECTLSPESSRKENEITLKIKNVEPRLAAKVIIVAFQKGYDKIHLYCTENIINEVEERIPELLGYAIIEKNQNYCLIQNITSKMEIDFDVILRKAFIIINDTLKSAYESFKKEDKKNIMKLTLRDKEVNKFCYYCQRVVNKDYYYLQIEGYTLYYLIRVLENLGDDVRDMLKVLTEIMDQNNHKIIEKILLDIIEIYDLAFKIFYTPTEIMLAKFFEKRQTIQKFIDTSMHNLGRKELEILFYLKAINDGCYHFAILKSDIGCKIAKLT